MNRLRKTLIENGQSGKQWETAVSVKLHWLWKGSIVFFSQGGKKTQNNNWDVTHWEIEREFKNKGNGVGASQANRQ